MVAQERLSLPLPAAQIISALICLLNRRYRLRAWQGVQHKLFSTNHIEAKMLIKDTTQNTDLILNQGTVKSLYPGS
jgi:hypothetical protein